ncbi:MAG: hypothetical protein LBJ89_03585 [Holosporales bacterium]|jgi:hypothetical protein|nr:hypothetical protein [Holosporales bacterium]
MLICGALALVVVERIINEYLGQLKPSRSFLKSLLQIMVALRQSAGFVKEHYAPTGYSFGFYALRFIVITLPWMLIPVTSQWRALVILFIFQADFLSRIAEYLASSEKISFTLVKYQTLTHLISQCIYIPVLFIIASLGTNSNFFLRGIVAIVALLAAVIHNNIGPFRAPITLNEASAMPSSPLLKMLNIMFSIALFLSIVTIDENIFQTSILKYGRFIIKILIIAIFSFFVFADIPSLRINQCRRVFRYAIAPTAGGILLFGILERVLRN